MKLKEVQIECFFAVANAKSFSVAAEQLYVSQSAVSKQIRILEEEWGFPLFDRKSRDVELTEAGKVMLDAVQLYMSGLNSAIERARGIARNPSVSGFRFGVFDGFRVDQLSEIIRSYHEKHSGTIIDLEEAHFVNLSDGLRNGAFDLVMTLENKIQQPDIEYEVIGSSQYVVLISRDHPLAEKKDLVPKDLEDQIFYISTSPKNDITYAVAQKICSESGFSIQHVKRVSNIKSALLCVELNQGATLLDSSVASASHSSSEFLCIPLESRTNVVLAWRRNNLSPVVPGFIEHVKECVKENSITEFMYEE